MGVLATVTTAVSAKASLSVEDSKNTRVRTSGQTFSLSCEPWKPRQVPEMLAEGRRQVRNTGERAKCPAIPGAVGGDQGKGLFVRGARICRNTEPFNQGNSKMLAGREKKMTFIWNRIQFPKIAPHVQGQLIFNNGAKLDNSMEKRRSFPQ